MIPPDPGRAAHLNLVAYELLLRSRAGDGTGPSDELAWLLARYALFAPQTAARLPHVRAALTPEVRRAITRMAAEASQRRDSAVPGAVPSPVTWAPGSRELPDEHVGTAAAARLLGVEPHAVRAAARREALAGSKDDAGQWAFTRADIGRYDDRRRRHGRQ